MVLPDALVMDRPVRRAAALGAARCVHEAQALALQLGIGPWRTALPIDGAPGAHEYQQQRHDPSGRAVVHS